MLTAPVSYTHLDVYKRQIMNKLSRWYDIHLFYANESVKNFHFTGDLERYDDFSEVLKMLEKATNIQFNINGKNVIISKTHK